MTKSTETVDVDETPEAVSNAVERMHWYELAKAEHAALKAWKQAGEVGDRPATPTLNEMNERYIAAGCAPGSAGGKRQRRSSSTSSRAPKMSDVDLVRRLRELLDETPTLSQSAATTALCAEGATIRQVRAAYKGEAANRPKPVKTPRASKRTGIEARPTMTTQARSKSAKKGAATRAAKRSKPTDDDVLAHWAGVLDEINQPHTAAELCAIAERESIAGVRPKMGKGEIVERITAAAKARTKHVQKSA